MKSRRGCTSKRRSKIKASKPISYAECRQTHHNPSEAGKSHACPTGATNMPGYSLAPSSHLFVCQVPKYMSRRLHKEYEGTHDVSATGMLRCRPTAPGSIRCARAGTGSSLHEKSVEVEQSTQVQRGEERRETARDERYKECSGGV